MIIPRRPGTGRQVVLAAALFFCAILVLLVRMRTLPSVGGVRLAMTALMEDFKLVIYCPAYLLVRGGNPYDLLQLAATCPVQEGMPMYLPATFLLHAPFGLLPLDASMAAYFVLTVLLTVTLAFAAYRLNELPVTGTNVVMVAGLLLLSRPGQWAVLLGQPALELALGTCLALYYARRRPWVSGLGLAVAACKPTFGAPLMVLMAARGDIRAVAAGAILTAALNLPLIALLADRAGGVQSLLQGILAGHGEWEAQINPIRTGWSVDVGALIGRFIGQRVSPWGQVALALGVLVPTAIVIRRLGHLDEASRTRLSTSLICVATLLAVHHQAYDLVLLAGPAVVLASGGLPRGVLSRSWEFALYGVFAVLGLNYFGSVTVLSRLEERPILWLTIASLNGVALLGTFLIYLGSVAQTGEARLRSESVPMPPPA